MNFLIVGLGSMGKRRARLIKGIAPQASVSGVDFSSQRREEAEGLGIRTFATLAEALAEKPDAAFVCTAPLSHHAIIKEVLLADVHVFTELNLVADGYDELTAIAKQRGLQLFLSSTMLYRGEVQYLQKRVKAFGKPISYLYH